MEPSPATLVEPSSEELSQGKGTFTVKNSETASWMETSRNSVPHVVTTNAFELG